MFTEHHDPELLLLALRAPAAPGCRLAGLHFLPTEVEARAWARDFVLDPLAEHVLAHAFVKQHHARIDRRLALRFTAGRDRPGMAYLLLHRGGCNAADPALTFNDRPVAVERRGDLLAFRTAGLKRGENRLILESESGDPACAPGVVFLALLEDAE